MRTTRKKTIAEKVGTRSGAPQRLRLIEKLSLEELKRRVLRYRDAYYNGVSQVSDEEFDALEDRLRELAPKDPLLKVIGHRPITGKMVTLPFPMGSLKKVRPDTGAQKWLDKNGLGPIDVSDKLDGVSVLIQNTGKATYNMYTRGNGTQGQDITYLVPSVAGIGRLRKGEAVRGELIMPKSNFSATWAENFVNARNLVSGAVNSKKADPKIVRDLVFVAHEMVSPMKSLRSASKYLKSNGFNVVDVTTFMNPSITELQDYYEGRRKKSKFEIDGLVMSSSNGDIIAFKMEVESKEAKVKTIEWALSRHKIYKPVIILSRAVNLSGANVTRVTGYNARYVVDSGIGPGATILVTRSGDVIPKVVGVVKKAEPNLPDNFKWDANRVDIIGEPTEGIEAINLKAKQLSEALRVLGVPNIRERSLAKIVEGGINTLYKMFTADDTDFQNAGLGPTQSDQLFTTLKEARLNATHVTMMKASGLFPRGYGSTRFEAILSEIPFERMIKLSSVTLRKNIAAIPGFTTTSASEFVRYLPKYIAFVTKLRWKPKKKSSRIDDPLAGQIIVFTGFRNRIWNGIVESRGGKVAASVTKRATIVVSKGDSLKTDKAKKLGIRVMSKEAFARAFNLPS